MKQSRIVVFENGKFNKAFLDIVYLVLLSLILFHKFLQTTMFGIGYPMSIRMLLRVLLVLYIGIKIWNGCRLSKYEAAFLVIFAGTAFLVWKNADYMEVIDVVLLIAGAYGIRFEKILKTYMAILIPCIIVTVAASRLGLVENLVYHREGIPRASFGFVYPTDFVALIFYLILSWCVLKNAALRWWDYVLFVLLAIFSYVFCNARMSVLCIMAAVVLFLILNWWNNHVASGVKKEKIEQTVGRILIFGMTLCAVIMILMTWLYDSDNITWRRINYWISNRLSLGKQGFTEFGVTLFGQDIPMVGMGKTIEFSEDYFFLDSSYIKILLQYGVILLVIIVAMFTINAYRAHKEKQYYLLIALNLMAVQCVVEHHVLEIAYNPFLLMTLADITSRKKLDV